MPLTRGMIPDTKKLSREFHDSPEGKPIEKPWAVYGWFMGPYNVGKVVRTSRGSLDIQYTEGQQYPSECWDPKWVHRFDNPLKAIAYFRVHQNSDYSKKEVIDMFLNNFPSEKANLEKLLSQS